MTITIDSSDDRSKKIWKDIQTIAARDGKSASDIARTAMEDYIKVHGSGNLQFSLDPWNAHPDFKALPSMGSPNRNELLEKLNAKEVTEILEHSEAWYKLAARTLQLRHENLDERHGKRMLTMDALERMNVRHAHEQETPL